jgi:hypothetical protein
LRIRLGARVVVPIVLLIGLVATVTATSAGAGPGATSLQGQVRDEQTGLPVDVCISVVDSAGLQVLLSGTSGDGWFQLDVPQPVDPNGYRLAFFVPDGDDCQAPARVGDPFPVWWQDIAQVPFDPTTPPGGATAVLAGSASLDICLGREAPATGPCPPPPDGHVTGTVRTIGEAPVAEACVVGLMSGPGGDVALAVTDAEGRYDLGGLPTNDSFVMGVLPPFSTAEGPCQFDGPPQPYPTGSLQPVWYGDVWIDLAVIVAIDDPEPVALAAGATPVTAPSSGIDFCLTTAPGDVVPRPSCATQVAAMPVEVAPRFTG